ncbi:MAG: glycosyltransferase family 4 protein [Candidatus Brocadiia bacterium]
MKPIRILEVVEAYAGGARKHVEQILRGLDRRRFDLHLACSVERGGEGEEVVEGLRAEGCEVEVVPMKRAPSARADCAALGQLTRLMKRGSYDVVHTHAAKAGFLGRLAARRARVPAVVHTPHTFPFERADTRLGWLYRRLERRAARWADRIVLVAPSQRETARRARLCEEEKLLVVENGIRPPEAAPGALRARYRRELELADEAGAVAFVGRLTPQKDVQTYLSAVSELRRPRPDVHAFLVGRTDNPRYLRSLEPRYAPPVWRVVVRDLRPAEPVLWSPSLPIRVLGHRADAADLVAAFDAVVLPSRYEGLPYSLLEAMARGVVPVASDVTGNRDAVEHERSGLLIEPGDWRGFARAVARLLDDAGWRRELAAAARQRVLTHYTEARFLGQMAELYEGLAAGR